MILRLLILAGLISTAEAQGGGSISIGGAVTFGAPQVEEEMEFDSDAQDFFDRIIAASSDSTELEKSSINTFVTTLKATNAWDHLIEYYPWVGTNLAGARVKLKYSPTNSSVLAITGMVETNYVPSRGVKGTSGRYFSTGYNYVDFVDNGGLSFFVNEDDLSSPANGFLIGTTLTAPAATILFNVANNLSVGLGNSVATPYGTKMFGSGLYRIGRETSTKMVLTVGGVPVYTNTTATSGTRDSVLTVFAGGGTTATTVWGSHAAIDDGLMTAAEVAAFAQAVEELNFSLGRTPKVPHKANFVFTLGQSTSIGLAGGSALSLSQGNKNRMMDTFRPTPNAGSTHYVGSLPLLVEFGVESHQSGFANLLSSFWKGLYPGSETNAVIMKSFGVNATAYSGLAKGTVPYDNSIDATERGVNLANNRYEGGSRVLAFLIKHGEADNLNANYGANLETWLDDYTADITPITGQSESIVFIMTQSSTWGRQNTTTNISAFAMLEKYREDPTRFVVSHARYMLVHGDGLHPTNVAYRADGEMDVPAYVTNVLYGQVYKALIITNTSISGTNVTVDYPANNLELKTNVVSNPGNFGFEWFDDAGPSVSITSVTVTDGNTITLGLSGVPSGGGFEVRYAYTTTSGSFGGPTTGPRGNVYDGDTDFTSIHGTDLGRYALHDRVPVPFSYNFP